MSDEPKPYIIERTWARERRQKREAKRGGSARIMAEPEKAERVTLSDPTEPRQTTPRLPPHRR